MSSGILSSIILSVFILLSTVVYFAISNFQNSNVNFGTEKSLPVQVREDDFVLKEIIMKSPKSSSTVPMQIQRAATDVPVAGSVEVNSRSTSLDQKAAAVSPVNQPASTVSGEGAEVSDSPIVTADSTAALNEKRKLKRIQEAEKALEELRAKSGD